MLATTKQLEASERSCKGEIRLEAEETKRLVSSLEARVTVAFTSKEAKLAEKLNLIMEHLGLAIMETVIPAQPAIAAVPEQKKLVVTKKETPAP